MIIGDVLSRLQDEGEAAELIFGLGDLALLVNTREQAESEGMGLVTYARNVMQRYAAEADGEEWVSAMGALSRAPDPGKELLKRALEYFRQPERIPHQA